MTCCNSSGNKILPSLLNEYCVYWALVPNSPNKFGENTYATPIELKCKWQTSTRKIRGKDGVFYTTSATVTLMNEVLVEGILWRGRLSDAPVTPPKNLKIVSVDQTDSVEMDETAWVAYL